MGFDYGLKDGPGLILGKFFPMSRGALSSASPALCRGGAWILKALALQKGGGLVMIGSTTQKGAIMSLKGFYKWGDTRFVYLKEFYTGLRYRVPRDKAYVAKSQDGVCVLADKKDAILGWEGGSL